MQFLYHLLLALPIFIFLQLLIYVIYLDRRSLTNWLCASFIFVLLFSSIGEYYFLITKDLNFIKWFNTLSSCLWAFIPAVFCHFILLLLEHHYLKKKWLLFLIYLVTLPAAFHPLFEKMILVNENSFLWSWVFNSDKNSILFWYAQILPFAVFAAIVYFMASAQTIKTSYRIQKQVSLIKKAIYITMAFLMIPWHISVIFNLKLYPVLENYGALIMTGTLVYGISRYRIQSLKTSKLITDMIEHFSGFTMVITPEGDILSANNQCSLYIGYEKSELENKNIYKLLENEDQLKSEVGKIALNLNYSPNIELRIKSKSNDIVQFKTGINAIRNQFDEVLGYFLIFYGLSDEVNRYDQLQKKFDLTNREKDVAMLLIKGLSNQAIADSLFISLATVKSHSHNIYSKTNTKNKSELRNRVYEE